MNTRRVARLRHWLDRLFPERHIYLRANGETRGYILTARKQMLLAATACAVGAWTILSTASMAVTAFTNTSIDREVSRTRARYERLMADRQARLDTAVVQLQTTAGSVDDLARTVEKRHAALGLVLGSFHDVPGAQRVLAPSLPPVNANRPPLERVLAVRLDQERLIARAETFAKTRAERLRLAFRLAGLNPAAYVNATGVGLGGPLIEAKDVRALAAVLDVDEAFAARIKNAADNLTEMRSLADAAENLPFDRPARAVRTTSGFGLRFDPFNRRPALHMGLDFAGPFMTPIYATAPGVVSFAGVRSGYGNTVEIDHGGGFKTRYAHLQIISVRPGERVAVGHRIAAMGSTGRSTGVHLHYEVWMNGRPQNPARFVKAGDYVQQN
ncbi:MAG TPA: peptidoglycan DD-metalloendopeptidase family protein [Caulobacteraceae bacterium]|nr:peptidoglycan DD-metalloendopeptidase family protein [Caulobacteraceae bacterium]